MEETGEIRSVMILDMQRDKGLGRFRVVRDLEGAACPHCGDLRYFLVLRMRSDGRNGTLAGRCSRCRTLRVVTAGGIEQDVTPKLKNYG